MALMAAMAIKKIEKVKKKSDRKKKARLMYHRKRNLREQLQRLARESAKKKVYAYTGQCDTHPRVTMLSHKPLVCDVDLNIATKKNTMATPHCTMPLRRATSRW